MAIKALMAKKRLDAARKNRSALDASLAEAQNKRSALRADESELEAAIDAAEEITPELEEQTDALNEAIAEADAAVAAVEEAIAEADAAVSEAESCLAEIEAQTETEAPPPAPEPMTGRAAAKFERRYSVMPENIRSRSGCFTTREAREAFFARSEVKTWIESVRSVMRAGETQRSVSGVSVLIPEVVLDLMRENIDNSSKLLKYCTVKPIKGTSRQPVCGAAPEAVWMEMVGSLNELDLSFTEIELDGYTVGGYFKIANSLLDDSDINLGEELIANLLAAVGKALDKAIVYGKGPASHMPVGFITRLAASSQPAWWGSKQGDFTDLHSSNVIKLNIGSNTGVSFFQPLLAALGKADPKYSDGKLVWVMNRKTHMDIVSRAMAFDSSAALVSQVNNQMPVIGGAIEECDFMADYEIGGGFMSVQIMAEREGATVGQSDQQFFVQNQTVFKGYARYDGKTARGECFVLVNYNNTDCTTAKDFAVDYANTALNTLICTAAAGTASGDTVVTVSGAKEDSPTLKYKAQATTGGIVVGDKLGTGWTALTSGTTQITAAAGCPIAVVELDSAGKVVSAGNVNSVPKT